MKQYREVHQFHSGSAYGDAVTNQMFSIRRELRRLGYSSDIYAYRVAKEFTSDVLSIRKCEGSAQSLLLFHHSMGSDCFEEVLALPHDIVTVYHNVTPGRYFPDENLRTYAQRGRDQLRVLAPPFEARHCRFQLQSARDARGRFQAG